MHRLGVALFSDGSWKQLIRKWGAALTLVAIVVGGIGVSVFILFGDTRVPDATQPPAALQTPVATPKLPTPEEFNIGVTVTDRNCPSADNCVYTYTIQPNYIGLHPLPDQPFAVTYQVRGGHEPRHGEFTVHGTEARFMKGVTVEGSAEAQFTAVPTQVINRQVFGPPVPVDPTPALPPPE